MVKRERLTDAARQGGGLIEFDTGPHFLDGYVQTCQQSLRGNSCPERTTED